MHVHIFALESNSRNFVFSQNLIEYIFSTCHLQSRIINFSKNGYLVNSGCQDLNSTLQSITIQSQTCKYLELGPKKGSGARSLMLATECSLRTNSYHWFQVSTALRSCFRNFGKMVPSLFVLYSFVFNFPKIQLPFQFLAGFRFSLFITYDKTRRP